MILTPRYHNKIIPVAGFRSALSGHFKIEKFKTYDKAGRIEVPGSRRVVSEFHNNITNNGLDRVAATNNYMNYCHVGTGTAAEANGDTALGAWVRAHDSLVSTTITTQASAPYYGSNTKVFRFDPPGSNHNYTEVGISEQATSGNLFSRALTKDGGGSPVAIAVDADEWLDVTYQLRLYPDHADVDDTGTVDGYGYTMRAANVTTDNYWGQQVARKFGIAPNLTDSLGARNPSSVIGAITAGPTGGSDYTYLGNSAATAGSYTNGTYNCDFTIAAGLSDLNMTGGIRTIQIFSSMGSYQLAFGTDIPKTSSDVLDFVFNFAWTRATIT